MTKLTPTSPLEVGVSAEHAPKPPSLISKLAAVMSEIDRVPKRGENKHFQYKYAMEADIVDAVRKHLADRHVMLVPSVESVIKDGKLTTVMMTFTFHDGDSGETLTVNWAGVGEDAADKGIWKAITGAVKYVLAKTFLMPTGDDPEQDEKPQPRAPQQTKPKRDLAPDTSTDIVSADQLKRLSDMLKTHNTNMPEFKAWVEKRFGATDSRQIKRKDYEAIVAYIVSGEDVGA